MKNVLGNLGAFLVAMVSFALTIALVLGLQSAVDLNLFSLMWWGIIPVGAFVTGLVAASGYYFAAVKLNLKATKTVAVSILVIAALFQVGLYYSQYAMTKLDDGQAISSLISFPRYVGWTLTHAKYGIIVHGYRPGGADGGWEVGFFGYLIAAVQFLALVVGGLVLYIFLADKTYCDACGKYLKPAAKLQLPFAGDMTVVNELRTIEPLSPAYFDGLRKLPSGGSAALELELSQCPRCKKEALAERPMFAKNGQLAYEGSSYRTMWAAENQSVAGELAALQPDPVTVPEAAA